MYLISKSQLLVLHLGWKVQASDPENGDTSVTFYDPFDRVPIRRVSEVRFPYRLVIMLKESTPFFCEGSFLHPGCFWR